VKLAEPVSQAGWSGIAVSATTVMMKRVNWAPQSAPRQGSGFGLDIPAFGQRPATQKAACAPMANLWSCPSDVWDRLHNVGPIPLYVAFSHFAVPCSSQAEEDLSSTSRWMVRYLFNVAYGVAEGRGPTSLTADMGGTMNYASRIAVVPYGRV